MESVFNLQALFPLSLSVLQTVFVTILAYLILDWWKIIKRPIEGMEYGAAIISAGFFFCCLLISSCSVGGIYESFRNYTSGGEGWRSLMWTKFFQFMLVICTAQLFFAGVVWMLCRLIIGKKSDNNAGSEKLVGGLLVLGIMAGLAIILRSFSEGIIENLIPRFKVFNGY